MLYEWYQVERSCERVKTPQSIQKSESESSSEKKLFKYEEEEEGDKPNNSELYLSEQRVTLYSTIGTDYCSLIVMEYLYTVLLILLLLFKLSICSLYFAQVKVIPLAAEQM